MGACASGKERSSYSCGCTFLYIESQAHDSGNDVYTYNVNQATSMTGYPINNQNASPGSFNRIAVISTAHMYI